MNACSSSNTIEAEMNKYEEKNIYELECDVRNRFYDHEEESVEGFLTLCRNHDSEIGLCGFNSRKATWEVYYKQKGDTLFFSVPKSTKTQSDISYGLELNGYIVGDSIFLTDFWDWDSVTEGAFSGSCKGIKNNDLFSQEQN